MRYEKYTFTFTHEVCESDRIIKRDRPMLYRYTSIRPLDRSKLQAMFEFVIDELVEMVVENND